MNAQEVTPKRYWWLKRLSIAYVALMLGAVGLRYQWLSLARAKLNAEVSKYHAQGQPILLEDFRGRGLPDEKNAAIVLRRVSAGLARSRDEVEQLGRINTPHADFYTGRVLLNRLEKAFAEIRRARKIGSADWKTQLKSPLLGVVMPHLNGVRELAHLPHSAAFVESNAGNHREAIEHCRDIVFLARSIQDEPFLISHLVSTGIDSLAATTTLSVARNMNTADAPARESARALIDELLEDQGLRKSALNALYGERAAQLDTVKHLAAGNSGRDIGIPVYDSPAQAFAYWWLRPAFEEDAVKMVQFTTQHVPAVEAQDSVTLRQKMPRDPSTNSANSIILSPLTRLLMPSFRNVFGYRYIAQREKNRAAIELARALYIAEHGKPPQRTEDLVPRYLPRVPADPANGGTMAVVNPAATQPAK